MPIATRSIYTPHPPGIPRSIISDATAQAMSMAGFTFQLREKTGTIFIPPSGVQGELTLVLPPESLTKTHRAKNSLQETQMGQWVDSYGLAAPRWQLSGTFGFKIKHRPVVSSDAMGGTDEIDGYQAHMEFEAFVRAYFETNRERAFSSDNQPPIEMWFFDWEDGDFWAIEPDLIPEKQRDAGRPLLRSYNFTFAGYRNLFATGAKEQDGLTALLQDRITRIGLLRTTLQTERDALISLEQRAAQQGWGAVINQKISSITSWINKTTDTVASFEDQTIGEAQRIVDNIDSMIESLAQNARSVDPNYLFADCIDTVRQIKCGIGVLMSFPEQFVDRFEDNMANFKQLFTDSGCSSTLPAGKPNV